jgi:hypothetical protein
LVNKEILLLSIQHADQVSTLTSTTETGLGPGKKVTGLKQVTVFFVFRPTWLTLAKHLRKYQEVNKTYCGRIDNVINTKKETKQVKLSK